MVKRGVTWVVEKRGLISGRSEMRKRDRNWEQLCVGSWTNEEGGGSIPGL